MTRQIGVPVVLPSYTPDRISTASASLRCVTWRDVPGRRRSSSGWMSASDRAMPGGQPSITQPMAGPCDSPKFVTWKRWPKVLPDMEKRPWERASILRCGIQFGADVCSSRASSTGQSRM